MEVINLQEEFPSQVYVTAPGEKLTRRRTSLTSSLARGLGQVSGFGDDQKESRPDLESFSEALMVVLKEERRYGGGGDEPQPGPLPLVGGGGERTPGRGVSLPHVGLDHRWVIRMRSGSGATGEEVAQLDTVIGADGPFCLGKLGGEAVVLRKERASAGLEEFLGGGGAEAAAEGLAQEALDARVMTVTTGLH